MRDDMRIMTENPLNAKTLVVRLQSWVTTNDVFFNHNQGQIPEDQTALNQWALTIAEEIRTLLRLPST